MGLNLNFRKLRLQKLERDGRRDNYLRRETSTKGAEAPTGPVSGRGNERIRRCEWAKSEPAGDNRESISKLEHDSFFCK